jgi:integrase
MAKALTAAAVEKFKPGDSRMEIPDGLLPGLYLVVQPTGKKSWAVRYRVAGKPQKLTLGPYPAFGVSEARDLARDAIQLVKKGGDPGREKKDARREAGRCDDLFPNVVRDYLTRYQKPNNRTWKEIGRLLGLKPDPTKPEAADDPSQFILASDGPAVIWEHRRIVDITRREIRDYVDDIASNRAPVGANRVLASIKKMLNWAIERDILEKNAAADLKAPTVELLRDRVLSDDELLALWRAAEHDGWPFGPLVQLLILTGQRRDEVGGMRRDEIDRAGEIWTVPRDRAKNDKAHIVPLPQQAQAIIAAQPRTVDAGGLVITTTGGTPFSGYSRAKNRISARMLLELKAIAADRGDDPELVSIPDWRLHDIRRTVASGMARLGVDLFVVEKVLNHISGSFSGIVRVYQHHSYQEEKRRALQLWADAVERLVTGKIADNVRPLRASK